MVITMSHNITNTCLRELPREYGENVDIILRLIDTELKGPEINIETIVDNIASLGAFNQKNLIRCDILSEFPQERDECENNIRNISEIARRDMINLISKRLISGLDQP
jgi:hypothetical protein